MTEPQSLREVEAQLVEWWLDVEAFDWDRERGVVRAPVGPPAGRIRFGIGCWKAPEAFHHELVVRHVSDVQARHDGEYPFAQAVQVVAYDPAQGAITIVLACDSLLRIRVTALDMRIIDR